MGNSCGSCVIQLRCQCVLIVNLILCLCLDNSWACKKSFAVMDLYLGLIQELFSYICQCVLIVNLRTPPTLENIWACKAFCSDGLVPCFNHAWRSTLKTRWSSNPDYLEQCLPWPHFQKLACSNYLHHGIGLSIMKCILYFQSWVKSICKANNCACR